MADNDQTAQDALKSAMKAQIAPALRSAGFKGSAPTWTLTSASGDRAVVNVQSSDSSSRDEVLFTINIAVVPLIWWRWTNYKLGKSEARAVKEYDGLWRERVDARRQQASNRTDWWSVTDAASAQRAADDVVEQLQDEVIPRLQHLFEPGVILHAARSGQLGMVRYDTRGAIAVLLTATAPSDELRDLLVELESLEDARLRSVFQPIVQWCRESSA